MCSAHEYTFEPSQDGQLIFEPLLLSQDSRSSEDDSNDDDVRREGFWSEMANAQIRGDDDAGGDLAMAAMKALEKALESNEHVWDAGVVLCKYLESPDCRCILAGKTWVDLGSGTGIIGLVAAQLGARVVLTDRCDTLSTLKMNVESHAGRFLEQPVVLAMDWVEIATTLAAGGKPEAISDLESRGLWPIDGVFIGDCIWFEKILEPLLTTLLALSEGPSGHCTEVVLSHEHRDEEVDTRVLAAVHARLGGALHQVPQSDLHPGWLSDRISVWRGTLIAPRRKCAMLLMHW